MIIDVNAYLGHYPFRKLKFTSAASMVRAMDAHGIDRAVVSSLHAVFYRDGHQGNKELFAAVKKFPQRLVPVATVNPKYVGWQQDLQESIEVYNAKAVTLLPSYHGYRLDDELGNAALSAIAGYKLPVVLTQRLEDRRQRHHWDQAEDLKPADLKQAALAHPNLRFLLSNWVKLEPEDLLSAELKGRCLLDFARLHVVLRKEVPELITALGVESVAFGSHMPFDYLGPSLVKLANLEMLTREDYEKIAWQNAAKFFGLEVH